MNKTEKAEILEKSKIWFKTSIMEQHQVNTRKLTSIKEFNVNPFLASYLAHFLTGNAKPESIAKALIYPRVLGTSINTMLVLVFKNLLQMFFPLSQVLQVEWILNLMMF